MATILPSDFHHQQHHHRSYDGHPQQQKGQEKMQQHNHTQQQQQQQQHTPANLLGSVNLNPYPNSGAAVNGRLQSTSTGHPGRRKQRGIHESAGQWRFLQSFGHDRSRENDAITTVEFDQSGDFIAVGDKAGRICIFEIAHNRERRTRRYRMQDFHHLSGGVKEHRQQQRALQYQFYTEFQSHESEIDVLKSLEIDEKINRVCWFPHRHSPLYLMSTNDKTIKFWKLFDQKVKRPDSLGFLRRNAGSGAVGPGEEDDREQGYPYDRRKKKGRSEDNGRMKDDDDDESDDDDDDLGSHASSSHGFAYQSQIVMPPLPHSQTVTRAVPRRIFKNAHDYHIHSISPSSDGMTFLSADDLRIHLWDLEINDECFNIVDAQPPNMDELTEVITSASFHPVSSNIMMYSTSRGAVRIADLRDSALCDIHAKTLEMEIDPAAKNFFSEIVSSFSDAKFTPDGRYIVTRDYLSMKIWDVNMEHRPVEVIPIHDHLQPYFCELYENDSIFDRFECSANPNGTKFLTGSYDNHFTIHDMVSGRTQTLQARRGVQTRHRHRGQHPQPAEDPSFSDPQNEFGLNSMHQHHHHQHQHHSAEQHSNGSRTHPHFQDIDFSSKALHVSWHPKLDCIAVAGTNRCFIYCNV